MCSWGRQHFRQFLSSVDERVLARWSEGHLILFEIGLAQEAREIVSGMMAGANLHKASWQSVPGVGEVPRRQLYLRGGLALAEGRWEEGIALLQAIEADGALPTSFLWSEVLAGALESKGDTAGAIRVLETASLERDRVNYPDGAFWLRVQARLAQLYRTTEDLEKAHTIEIDLLQRLAYADPDHPIFLQIQGS